MKGPLLLLLLAALSPPGAEGVKCYVGSGMVTELMYNPAASLTALFDPSNTPGQAAPAAPVTGTLDSDCETVTASAGSSHCTIYTSGATRTWACSNPKTSTTNGQTVLNNCTDGVADTTAVKCCNATDSCNKPAVAASPTPFVSSKTCLTTVMGSADPRLRATMQSSSAMVLNLMNDTATTAVRVLAGGAAPAARIPFLPTDFSVPPLGMSGAFGVPVARACRDDVTTSTATSCFQMTVHNFGGTQVSLPIWGCLGDHLRYLGVNAGVSTTRATIQGSTLVTSIFDESASMYYRSEAFKQSPPAVPIIPAFDSSKILNVANDVSSLLGPSSISYTSCEGPDPCNAFPTASSNGCFSLNPGALFTAKAAVDSGQATSALSALYNTAQSCSNVVGHVDTCLSVTFQGTPIMGGCWSPVLEGVAMADLRGGSIQVDCGDGKNASGIMPIPPAFVFGLPVPLDQIMFTCCKGDLCNIDGAQIEGVLIRGVDVVMEVSGFTSTSDYVRRGKKGFESSVAAEVGVAAASVFTTTSCEGTADDSCTWFFQPPPGQVVANARRRQAGPVTITIHVNTESRRDLLEGGDRRAMSPDQLYDVASTGTFQATLLNRMKAAMPDVSGLDITITAVEKSDGGVRAPNALAGAAPRHSRAGGAWLLPAAAALGVLVRAVMM